MSLHSALKGLFFTGQKDLFALNVPGNQVPAVSSSSRSPTKISFKNSGFIISLPISFSLLNRNSEGQSEQKEQYS